MRAGAVLGHKGEGESVALTPRTLNSHERARLGAAALTVAHRGVIDNILVGAGVDSAPPSAPPSSGEGLRPAGTQRRIGRVGPRGDSDNERGPHARDGARSGHAERQARRDTRMEAPREIDLEIERKPRASPVGGRRDELHARARASAHEFVNEFAFGDHQ